MAFQFNIGGCFGGVMVGGFIDGAGGASFSIENSFEVAIGARSGRGAGNVDLIRSRMASSRSKGFNLAPTVGAASTGRATASWLITALGGIALSAAAAGAAV